MWESFVQAFALMLIFEGVMPFASPAGWREMMARVLGAPDKTVRTFGFVSMTLGVLILQVLHQ